jgi:hypothetical protein
VVGGAVDGGVIVVVVVGPAQVPSAAHGLAPNGRTPQMWA